MIKYKPIQYLKENVKSGDLIFFQPNGYFLGEVITTSCQSPWCHVALVVEMWQDLFIHQNDVVLKKGEKYIWESALDCDMSSLIPKNDSLKEEEIFLDTYEIQFNKNNDDDNDYFLNNQKRVLEKQDGKRKGAIITPFIERLERCGHIGYLQLKINNCKEKYQKNDIRDKVDELLYNHIIEYHTAKYEENWCDLINVWCHSVFCLQCCCISCEIPSISTRESFFCSELIAKALMDANIICKKRRNEKIYWSDKSRICFNFFWNFFCDCTDGTVYPGEFDVENLSNSDLMNTCYVNNIYFSYDKIKTFNV